MSHPAAHSGYQRRPWIAPLAARSREEEHRVSTPLELLFDLVVVVAVARAGTGLHEALSEGHVGHGVLAYSMAFFAIWWAWVNFTWFASAYDSDDVTYRLLVLLQMTGALLFAAGIPQLEDGNFVTATLGYVVMRLALVVQWLRAARADAPRRRCARRYALGIFLVQCAWVSRLWAPREASLPTFAALAILDILVPVWAERAGNTTWHPHHIAERYGLFTIIALGESVLAASNAIETATVAGVAPLSLLPIIMGGLLILFGCWWLYFDREAHEILSTQTSAFLWGYGHYFVFGAAAAIGAGLTVAVGYVTHPGHLSATIAGAAVAVPVAVYLGALWFLHSRSEEGFAARVAPVVVVAILFTPLTPQPVLFTGLAVAALTLFKIVRATRHA